MLPSAHTHAHDKQTDSHKRMHTDRHADGHTDMHIYNTQCKAVISVLSNDVCDEFTLRSNPGLAWPLLIDAYSPVRNLRGCTPARHVPPAGLEPAIFGLEVRRLVH